MKGRIGLRILALVTAMLLVMPMAAAVAQEPEDGYVTVYIPFETEADWLDNVVARYADTGEVIPLSGYFRGTVFATVPQADADREIEAVKLDAVEFVDAVDDYNASRYSMGMMSSRGVINGVGGGEFYGNRAITMAEAVTMVARTLDIQPTVSTLEVKQWYEPAMLACAERGIIDADEFIPGAQMSRQELTKLVYDAFCYIGWLDTEDDGEAGDEWPVLWDDFADADDIDEAALLAYTKLLSNKSTAIGIYDYTDDGMKIVLSPAAEATRYEAVELLASVLDYLPVCPSAAAIEYGFHEDFPVIDGSTSTYPFTESVYGYLFSNYRNHPMFPQVHSKSHASYEMVISGDIDMMFASVYPASDILELAKEQGVELELIPVAYDAQVFFTNAENPVDGLTMEQIADIYVDNAYDNWNELGGPDATLVPYCRNIDSGSHAQMERNFLDGKPINDEILSETTSEAMQSILTDVYGVHIDNPDAYGLGYSIYYYYQSAMTVLFGDDDYLKLLEIDGVYPSDETIADGSYPLANNAYVVLRSDEPEDSPARKMAEFMLSEAGQECVINAGYGALMAE